MIQQICYRGESELKLLRLRSENCHCYVSRNIGGGRRSKLQLQLVEAELLVVFPYARLIPEESLIGWVNFPNGDDGALLTCG